LIAHGSIPEFVHCVSCGRPALAESSRFSVREGGLCCGSCQPNWLPGDRPLARRTLQALALLVRGGVAPRILEHALALPSDDLEAALEASAALGDCLDAQVGRAPRSRALLDEPGLRAPTEEGDAEDEREGEQEP